MCVGDPEEVEAPDEDVDLGHTLSRQAPEPLIRLSVYIDGRGVPLDEARSLYAPMGKRAVELYREFYGGPPQQVRRRYNGGPATGYGYRPSELFILDRAFDETYRPTQNS